MLGRPFRATMSRMGQQCEGMPSRSAKPSEPPAPGTRQVPADRVQQMEHLGQGEPAEPVTRVEHITPLWKLLGVIAAFGCLAALGHYLDVIGHAEDLATVAVITIAYTISFWARRHPGRLEARLGPFGRIGRAIAESQDDLRRWVHERTLLAGVLIATLYGVGVVIGKHIILYVMAVLYSPWLAIAGGCAVGALVISPELWRSISRRLSQ